MLMSICTKNYRHWWHCNGGLLDASPASSSGGWMFYPSTGNPKYFKIRLNYNYAKLEVLTTEL